MRDFELSGRRALVTGGNRGLGSAIASTLAEAGVRDVGSGAEAVDRIVGEGGRASAIELDEAGL